MWPFKQVKNWFFPPCEYRDSVAALVAYLPIGNLDNLLCWSKKWIPYRSDTNTGKPDGVYDPLQNYNGADLTIKAKGGDCESIAAVFVEVIDSPEWTAAGWASQHICMVYSNNTAHDVCFFDGPNGTGWIDGAIYYGTYTDMRAYYDSIGWRIIDWWIANDLGQEITEL